VVAVVEATADGNEPRLARREVRANELNPGCWTPIALAFDVAELRWVGQLCVYSAGVDALAVDTAVAVDDRGTAVWPPLALQ
jgi:hypothetical protein